jgi:hypothetical protein
MKGLSNITAVILLLFGSAWLLAGLNLIGDTSMSGERLWAAAGAATAAEGLSRFLSHERGKLVS